MTYLRVRVSRVSYWPRTLTRLAGLNAIVVYLSLLQSDGSLIYTTILCCILGSGINLRSSALYSTNLPFTSNVLYVYPKSK